MVHGDEKLLQYGPYDAQIKREAILEQRRLKLARHKLYDSPRRIEITILQRLVEQCAQEVARCKEVARQQQLKNQEEIDRRRANLERRQKATAARRAKLLTVPNLAFF
ncbi:unnamed protein product [Rhizophagus irregularis]|nr:unnamed protein product [Rhizophagus irregularis]